MELLEEVVRRHLSVIRAQLGEREAADLRDAPRPPCPKRLWRKPKPRYNDFGANGVDQRAMGVFMDSHSSGIHATLIASKHKTLLEIHGGDSPSDGMGDLGVRIRERIEDLGISQAEAARASGCSAARFGNYCSGTRNPDLDTLVRIARALRTTTDWLLGISEVVPVDTKAVILRLLDLEGMPQERAEVIAFAAEEALRLLAALPNEGDARTRALLAAQAAWQMRPSAKPA